MNGKPMMIVENSRAISLKEARKAIASFVKLHSLEDSSPEALAVTNRERLSLVSEEIIENLSTIHVAIDEEVSGENSSVSGSPFGKQKVTAKQSESSSQVNGDSSVNTDTNLGKSSSTSSSSSSQVGNGKALHKEMEKQAGADSESSDNAEEQRSKSEKKDKKSKSEKMDKKEKKEKKDKKRKSESGEKTPKTKKLKTKE